MNKLIRQFERESGLEIFGLGARREIWEQALEKYAELIVLECVNAVMDGTKEGDHYAQRIENHFDNSVGGTLHFAVEESPGWVCAKCGTDRTKAECPLGHTASLDGRCPMTAKAQ